MTAMEHSLASHSSYEAAPVESYLIPCIPIRIDPMMSFQWLVRTIDVSKQLLELFKVSDFTESSSEEYALHFVGRSTLHQTQW